MAVTLAACAGPAAPSGSAGAASASISTAASATAGVEGDAPTAAELETRAWLRTLKFSGLNDGAPTVAGVENAPNVTEMGAILLDLGAVKDRPIELVDLVKTTQYEVAQVAGQAGSAAIVGEPTTSAVNAMPREIRELVTTAGPGAWVAFAVPSPQGPIIRLTSLNDVSKPPAVAKVDASLLPNLSGVALNANITPQGAPAKAKYSSAALKVGSGAQIKIGDEVTYSIEFWDWETGRSTIVEPFNKPHTKLLGEVGYPCIDDALVGHRAGSTVEIVCDRDSLNPDPMKGAATASEFAIVARVEVTK